MKQFLLHAWEDINEIILHLFTSGTVIICFSFVFFLIDFVTKYLFSESNYSIMLMEIASQMTIFALFFVYVYRSLIRAIKTIKR
ncbi:Uncharacterised protein [uncultured archaeon]|nr:Uncharacterised protein [uncultured archaeon]